MLVKAVTEKYSHASGHVFIEKMVQVPVRVPRLEVQLDEFLAQLLPDWNRDATELPAGFTSAVFDVASTGLDFNPRQIKRLINSMLVLLRVADSASSEVDARLLAGVVGLQLRWPDEYRDLADAVFSADTNPTESLRGTQDEDLRRYTTTFFEADLDSAALRPILTLTRVVASPTDAGVDDDAATDGRPATSATDLREVNLSRLLEALAANGFAPSQRLSSAFYKATLPEVRVKIGKTVVRIEGRARDTRWHLGESFLITTAINSAIAAIESDVEMRSKAIEATRQFGGLAVQ